MKQLRSLIDVLSDDDVKAIHGSFYRDSDKVALLFYMLLEQNSNEEIKQTLNLSKNAYTTLGSRLKNKIENHLVEIRDSPKDDILRKLQNIDEILFDQEPQLALATLKKLEYELKKYDLSNELTIVYKHLKRFYLNKPEYFTYSKLYNRHVAYSLALDKAQDILGNYFKEYGFYYVMKDVKREVNLTALFEEMLNVCALYQSHRMQVYLAAMEVVHRLHVDPKVNKKQKRKPIEDIFSDVEKIFSKYRQDSLYHHLKLIFKVFQFEYYFAHKVFDKASTLRDELRPAIPQLLQHYENYGFPAQLLNGLLILDLENEPPGSRLVELPDNLELGHVSDPSIVMIYMYQAIVLYYQGHYDEASKWLFELNNRVSFKDFPELFTEVKCLITLVKYQQQDSTLFTQNYSSAQRLLRRLDKKAVPGLASMIKFLGALAGKNQIDRDGKMTNQIKVLEATNGSRYRPLKYLLPALKEGLKKIN